MKKIKLDEIKRVETNILKYIDDVCTKNNIPYFIYAGTLIGAIRHKGFIPWDDDIDIALTRENYVKLIELLKKDNNVRYKVFDHETQSNYFYPFAKIVDTDTIVYEKNFYKIDNYGLYVDIFALDFVPENEKLKEKHYKNVKKKQRLIFYYAKKKFEEKNIIKLFVKSLVRRYAKIKGLDKILNEYNTVCMEYNNDDKNCKYMLNNWSLSKYDRAFLNREAIESGISRAKFEDIEVNIPNGYDSILRAHYGNYMELPPEDERINHCMEAYWKEDK